jgi:TolB-like protein
MEQDETATLAALKRRRKGVLAPLVSEHHGRIVKVIGDGVLVEFASAVNAVACAVELQKQMAAANDGVAEGRRIVLRVGINLGDVIVEGGDLYGNGVIIAVRLQALAAAGSILVSHTVHEHVDRKLSVRFDDQGERALKNIARPIRVYRADWADVPAGSAPPIAQGQPGLSDQASIAVLPFVNMSTDAEQEFFADGLAEDLITDLSKVPGLLVIARNSSFSYKGQSIDVRSIAGELGVRYVIEGSVRRASSRVRINAQLVDAVNGSHIWADRFDRDLIDIFLMQDEVVGKIVSALSGALPSAHSLPKRRATSLEAYELFVHGRSLVSLSFQDTRAARRLLEKAIELDPGFAEAYAWLAMSHHFGSIYCGEGEEHRMLARSAARQAMSLDPENADAHIVLGYVRAYEGELSEGVAEFEHGLRINPNHADGWAMLTNLRVLEVVPRTASIACAMASA